MGFAAWMTGCAICVCGLAADDAPQAKPEPPSPPDEWTTAIEGKVGLWQVTAGSIKPSEGVIPFPAGIGSLQSEHLQRNFTVSFEWKSTGKGPSQAALYFRASTKAGVPSGPSISLVDREAGLLRGETPKKSSILAVANEWNSFRLEVAGDTARLKIKDLDAWEVKELAVDPGVLAIVADLPVGAGFQIRNLAVVESGYRPLFNGKDTEGWSGGGGPAEACWKVDGGLLQCTGAKGPWLKSKEEFGDFNLRLEYRLPAAGNSGVYVRVPADGNHHGKDSGVEIQVLDDAHKSYARLQKYQYTGSVYAVAPAMERVARPAGEWNSLEINCKGSSYRVVHNGVVIVDVDESKFPALKERRLKGFLGLQNHSSVVSFRNIRLGPAE